MNKKLYYFMHKVFCCVTVFHLLLTWYCLLYNIVHLQTDTFHSPTFAAGLSSQHFVESDAYSVSLFASFFQNFTFSWLWFHVLTNHRVSPILSASSVKFIKCLNNRYFYIAWSERVSDAGDTSK